MAIPYRKRKKKITPYHPLPTQQKEKEQLSNQRFSE
jgi:hypothetical protein